MKILYIINRIADLAGIERILSCKMNYLAENTDILIYLTTYEQNNAELSFQLCPSIKYCPINSPTPKKNKSTFFEWLKMYIQSRMLFKKQFNKLLSEIHPDIVISTIYSYEVIDIITYAARQIQAKAIIESHIKGDTVSMAKYMSNYILHKAFLQWDNHLKNSLKKCECIVALTNADANYWRDYNKNVKVIPNMLTIVPQRVKNYHKKRVIAAGRYAHQKGFDMLLKAWHILNSKFGDWHLYIFGNGDRGTFQEMVDKLGLNNSVYLMPATTNIAEEFSNSSIYVMSSRFEGFPLVLGEAMSCGLPCVSFDCPYGPREIITNGEDGIIVENGNIKELAYQLGRLMSDYEMRKAMGEKAIMNISRYKPESIMKQWIDLFQNI